MLRSCQEEGMTMKAYGVRRSDTVLCKGDNSCAFLLGKQARRAAKHRARFAVKKALARIAARL